MSYRCPICDKETVTSSAMRTHIVGTIKKYIEHLDWLESHNISYPDLVKSDNYTPLINVIEKECKIDTFGTTI